MNLELTRGMRPPQVSRTASLLKLYLDREKGGVGYAYEEEVDSTLKIVARIETKPR